MTKDDIEKKVMSKSEIMKRFGIKKLDLPILPQDVDPKDKEQVEAFLEQEIAFARAIERGPCSPFRRGSYGSIHIIHEPYRLKERMEYL